MNSKRFLMDILSVLACTSQPTNCLVAYQFINRVVRFKGTNVMGCGIAVLGGYGKTIMSSHSVMPNLLFKVIICL